MLLSTDVFNSLIAVDFPYAHTTKLRKIANEILRFLGTTVGDLLDMADDWSSIGLISLGSGCCFFRVVNVLLGIVFPLWSN